MSASDDDGVINLRKESHDYDEPEFKIERVAEEYAPGVDSSSLPASDLAVEPNTKVRVKFDKFVNLVATHAYEEIFDKHADEDVIISTDLLADLANAHEEKDEGKKVPAFFLVGILLGVGIAWILLKT